ncbi:MAG: 50S ribosomal protein L17 [Bacteroidales bacterium]|nr:50S ribosomal protein L17 [Bacteroidales bacterium]MDD3890913.1 50S ribosomal protein L17 [Bacteroidales bacterium]
MRHNKKFNHLSRTSSHRKSMLSNMAGSLIKHKRINTTVAKAKALRIYVEPLITKSKSDTTHSRRVVFSHLKDKAIVAELFRDVAVKVGDRPGGYTRILKTGTRLGDNAEMCIIELVDYNTTYVSETKSEKPQAKRTRRGKAGKTDEPKVIDDVTAEVKSPDAEVKEKKKEAVEKVKEVKSETVESPKSTEAKGEKDTDEKKEDAE